MALHLFTEHQDSIMLRINETLHSLCLIALCIRFSLAADKVLFIGDSWAELAEGSVFETICDNSMVVNEGIGGTTAEQWRKTDTGDYLRGILQANDDAKSVWISLGGNDLLESNCQDISTVADNMRAVVSIVVNELPNAKILLIPYGRFPCPDDHPEIQCSTDAFLGFAPQLQTIAEDYPTVAFVDTLFLFGGSVNQQSSSDLWDDCIHLNTAGYQILWQSEAKQHICPSAFGVTPSPSAANMPPADACGDFEDCNACLGDGECVWTLNQCLSSCQIADVACYEPNNDNEGTCAQAAESEADSAICSPLNDCETCTSTLRSDGSRTCEWYESGYCGTGDCDFNGACGSTECSGTAACSSAICLFGAFLAWCFPLV